MRTRFMDIDFFHQKLMVQDDLISKEAPCILRTFKRVKSSIMFLELSMARRAF